MRDGRPDLGAVKEGSDLYRPPSQIHFDGSVSSDSKDRRTIQQHTSHRDSYSSRLQPKSHSQQPKRAAGVVRFASRLSQTRQAVESLWHVAIFRFRSLGRSVARMLRNLSFASLSFFTGVSDHIRVTVSTCSAIDSDGRRTVA